MQFFHPSPRFITSFSGIWEKLISIASPVDCGMGRAIAPAALPWALDPPVSGKKSYLTSYISARWRAPFMYRWLNG